MPISSHYVKCPIIGKLVKITEKNIIHYDLTYVRFLQYNRYIYNMRKDMMPSLKTKKHLWRGPVSFDKLCRSTLGGTVEQCGVMRGALDVEPVDLLLASALPLSS